LKGFGKKDIFFARELGGKWAAPIHLDARINSKEDDFGLITDLNSKEGYFSSSREKSDDIFRFYTHIPQLFACDAMQTNKCCIEFWDEEYPGVDSLPVVYEWNFSDGATALGLRVSHCFPGAGTHWASLNIIDDRTDSTFYTQDTMEFEILDHEQPFITGNDPGMVDSPMVFSGIDSNLPGFVIEQYIWDFGDGGFAEGPEVEHVYAKPGSYMVKLGLKGRVEAG